MPLMTRDVKLYPYPVLRNPWFVGNEPPQAQTILASVDAAIAGLCVQFNLTRSAIWSIPCSLVPITDPNEVCVCVCVCVWGGVTRFFDETS